MTRIITIVGGKGGVGKTTLVSNLSAALSELGQEVVAVDANLTTPNLGLHLGMHLVPNTLHDVLKGGTSLRSAIYPHPSGFKVLPSSMNINDLKGVDVGKLPEVTLSLIGKADYVIVDSSAGLGREAINAIYASTEILLITNPDLPSVADALKTARIAREANKRIAGVVVNRVRKKSYELTKKDIEEMLDLPVLAEIPEDKNVHKSIAIKKPVIEFAPFSPASIEIRRLAHILCDIPFRYKEPFRFNIIEKLVGWMTR